MAAPAVGSSQANTSGGLQLQDMRMGATRQLADGSFSAVSSTGGIWTAKSLGASTTTVVKTGAGQLHSIICGTATGNLTLYDNTAASGTVILATCALLVGTTVLDISFGVGLTAVLSGAGVATATFL
jgi:hypothetical protein